MRNYSIAVDRGSALIQSAAKPSQLVGAFLLGGMIIYGAGFINTAAVHNAMHDARHSQGFPFH